MPTLHGGDITTDCAECIRADVQSLIDAQEMAVCADGGFLCPRCVNAEAAIIADANMGNFSETEDTIERKQWRIIGRQRNIGGRVDEDCAHCYSTPEWDAIIGR